MAGTPLNKVTFHALFERFPDQVTIIPGTLTPDEDEIRNAEIQAAGDEQATVVSAYVCLGDSQRPPSMNFGDLKKFEASLFVKQLTF